MLSLKVECFFAKEFVLFLVVHVLVLSMTDDSVADDSMADDSVEFVIGEVSEALETAELSAETDDVAL